SVCVLRAAARRRRRLGDHGADDRADAGAVRGGVRRARAGLRGGVEVHGREARRSAGRVGAGSRGGTTRHAGPWRGSTEPMSGLSFDQLLPLIFMALMGMS